jgi:tetratricopeptide (TPR) repeat protein
MLFSIVGIVAGLDDDSVREKSPSEHKILMRGFALVASIGLLAMWIFCAYLPAQKVSELKKVAADASNIRTNEYGHLFHSAGSYAFVTDPSFYTLAFATVYSKDQQLFLSNSYDGTVAKDEIESLLANINSIWNARKNDYKLALSALELENLDMSLSRIPTPAEINQAKIYFNRAVSLSSNEPENYLNYAETLRDENNIVGSKQMIETAIAIYPQNLNAWKTLLTFDQNFDPPDYQTDLASAKKAMPEESF